MQGAGDRHLTLSEAALPPDVMPEVMRALRARINEFHAAGGRIVVGSDAARAGVRFGAGVHRELELLVESGLAPRQALQAATVEAARVLGTDQLGVVAVGRAADLTAVRSDATTDISAIREVGLVFRDGRLVVDRRTKG
jgi:imidazolonepropionase-like amidohydrolase